MPSIEKNVEEWREIRSRVDSIASAVFLVAGGALSLSITVVVGKADSGLVSSEVASHSICAWYALLIAVLLFLLLKGYLVIQAFILQFKTDFMNRHLVLLNVVGWSIGVLGFAAFVTGLFRMVQAAALVVGTL